MKKQKKSIPEEIALKICEEIREKNSKKRISLAKGQCWGCMRYSKKRDDVKARCIFGAENNRGCQLVNKVFNNM